MKTKRVILLEDEPYAKAGTVLEYDKPTGKYYSEDLRVYFTKGFVKDHPEMFHKVKERCKCPDFTFEQLEDAIFKLNQKWHNQNVIGDCQIKEILDELKKCGNG